MKGLERATIMPPDRKSFWSKMMSLFIIISLILSIYALFRVVTAQPGDSVTLAPGVTVTKEARGIEKMERNEKGDVVVYYTDGTSQNIGQIPPLAGENGKDAIISPEQIAAAVQNYCGNGKCDGRSVTASDVALAVQNYCNGNVCKGADGREGKDAVVTSDMLAVAVSTYCSGGLCKGDTGSTGATGASGTPTTMSCVIRTTNTIDTRYVAWKYTNEADSAYRDLYKLPVWAECTSPVDLRTV